MTTIKPCPFCGLPDVGFKEGSTFRWVVAVCHNCGAQAPEVRSDMLSDDPLDAGKKDRANALEAWNRRNGE